MAEGFQVDLSTFWGVYYRRLSDVFGLRRRDKEDLSEDTEWVTDHGSRMAGNRS